jgi:hypothetical protein
MRVRDFADFLTLLDPLTLFGAHPAPLVRRRKMLASRKQRLRKPLFPGHRPNGLLREKTCRGKYVWYYRKGHGPRIRIHGEYGSPEFIEAYKVAKGGGAVILPRLIPEGRRDRPRDHRKLLEILRSVRRAFASAKQRAAKKGLPFDLTEDWALEQIERQGFKCAVTGIRFLADPSSGRARPYTPSFDRIDNSKGYTIDNVRIVVFAANLMMLDWGEQVFHRVSASYQRVRPPPPGS